MDGSYTPALQVIYLSSSVFNIQSKLYYGVTLGKRFTVLTT